MEFPVYSQNRKARDIIACDESVTTRGRLREVIFLVTFIWRSAEGFGPNYPNLSAISITVPVIQHRCKYLM